MLAARENPRETSSMACFDTGNCPQMPESAGVSIEWMLKLAPTSRPGPIEFDNADGHNSAIGLQRERF
jgi:hypothetical protein